MISGVDTDMLQGFGWARTATSAFVWGYPSWRKTRPA